MFMHAEPFSSRASKLKKKSKPFSALDLLYESSEERRRRHLDPAKVKARRAKNKAAKKARQKNR